MQPALTAEGVYLNLGGGGPDADEAGVRRAIFSYNHAQWYVDLVMPAYLSYKACLTDSPVVAPVASPAPIGMGWSTSSGEVVLAMPTRLEDYAHVA